MVIIGADTVTLHAPTAILGPLITAAIISLVTSYWWLIRKSIQLSSLVKDIQINQDRLVDKVDRLGREDRSREKLDRQARDERLRNGG